MGDHNIDDRNRIPNPLKSGASNIKAFVSFKNSTDRVVDVVWMNFNGQRQSFTESVPKQQRGTNHPPSRRSTPTSAFRVYCISKGGVAGEIRRWTYFSEAQLLVYDVVKNWCENIGRQHMSNNIMILVDLRRGVYYQKCHDPTCRAQGYKSDDHPVPPEHLPSFTYWDEDELINVSLRVEEDARSNEMNQNSFCSDFDSFHDDNADEELIKLGERYDAPETGIDGKTVHRTVNLVQLRPSPTFKSSISPSGIQMDVPV